MKQRTDVLFLILQMSRAAHFPQVYLHSTINIMANVNKFYADARDKCVIVSTQVGQKPRVYTSVYTPPLPQLQ